MLAFNTTERYLVQGRTPLHSAAICNKKEDSELLLARGADKNAKDCEVSHWGLLSLTKSTGHNASTEFCFL